MTVAALLIGSLLALNIGANNAGTTVGGLVGARIWTRRRAAVLAALFLVLGAVTLGRPVAETVSTAFVGGVHLTIAVPLIAAALLLIANLAGVPMSTTAAVVAPAVGLGFAAGTLDTQRLGWILGWWLAAPPVAAAVSYALWRGRFLRRRRLTPVAAMGALFLAFAAGANNAGNVAGPWSGVVPFEIGVPLAAAAMALGVAFGGRVTRTVGGGLVPLCRRRAAVLTLTTGGIALAASASGAPVSIAGLVTGSLLGISLASRGWGRTVGNPDMRRVAAVWGASPVAAGLVAYWIGGVL